ncbi:isatin hydrolase-like [Paramacrobiotus metropolitanus]|uniref:isatin hydrolase-like n=1 Tax=Paramacrobiotus metropolitanus TaxID=2943436 RepID=UPI0024456502|nr:isatin hydrolase-like [Paramacrobiotus metropolitanus]
MQIMMDVLAMFVTNLLGVVALWSTVLAAPSGRNLQALLDASKIVDLSYAYNDATIYWPNLEPLNATFSLTALWDQQEKGYYYRSKLFRSAEHGGTHLDAPAHFAKEGKDVSQLEVSQLFGPAVVVNVSAQVRDNPDYQVSLQDIRQWEAQYGAVPDGAFVLMYSNWDSARYPQKAKVFGSENYSDVSTLHFPGFHPDATRFLVKRNIRGIGVDTPSTDYGQSKDFPTHVILSTHNRIGLENVANLERVPASGALLLAAPLKIEKGSGAPVRLYAFLP